ncbi:hypothetical protein TYRP_014015 [Tyrophagus putrescentiae]|nr:hypothetical protein TYRP_014015 [Tyrophagus putrescentiae]
MARLMRYLRMLRGDRFPKSCTTITSTLPTRAKRAVMVKVTAISTCPLNEEIVSRLSSSKQPVSLEMPILCCSERYHQKFGTFQNSVYGKTMHSYGGGHNACKSMAHCIPYAAPTNSFNEEMVKNAKTSKNEHATGGDKISST